MFGSLINGWLRSPAALSDEALELTWTDFKAQIMQTSPYENELKYKTLYSTCTNLREGLVHRHRHIILDGEAVRPFYHHIRRYDGFEMVYSTAPNSIPTEVLAGLVLLSYRGGRVATSGGEVVADSGFVINGIKCLIHEKESPLGLFLKGFVLKYGIAPYLPPNLDTAEICLTAARDLGVGAATIELAYLSIHQRKLANVKCIHADHNNYQQRLLEA